MDSSKHEQNVSSRNTIANLRRHPQPRQDRQSGQTSCVISIVWPWTCTSPCRKTKDTFLTATSMGQSAFGKGFGQIDKVFNPSQVLSKRDKAWSKIPNAIFDGLADRYRVRFTSPAIKASALTISVVCLHKTILEKNGHRVRIRLALFHDKGTRFLLVPIIRRHPFAETRDCG